MRILILLLLLQQGKEAPEDEIQFKVRDAVPDLVITAAARMKEDVVIGVRRLDTYYGRPGGVNEHWRGVLEVWRDVSATRVRSNGGVVRHDLTLKQGGQYEVIVGPKKRRLLVTRYTMRDWEKEIKAIREIGTEMGQVAQVMEQTEKPSSAQKDQWRKRLVSARNKLIRLRTEFTASERALMDAFDRLYHHRKILDLTADPNDERAKLYGIKTPEERGIKLPSPMEEVKDLGITIKREACVKIIDEMFLMLPEKEKPEKQVKDGSGEKGQPEEKKDGEQKDAEKKGEEGKEKKEPEPVLVLRWKSRADAFSALKKAHEVVGGFEQVGELAERARLAETQPDAGVEFPTRGEVLDLRGRIMIRPTSVVK